MTVIVLWGQLQKRKRAGNFQFKKVPESLLGLIDGCLLVPKSVYKDWKRCFFKGADIPQATKLQET